MCLRWHHQTPLRDRVNRSESADPRFDRRSRFKTQILAVRAGDNLHTLGEAAGNMRWNRHGWHPDKARCSAKPQGVAHLL